MLPRHHSELYAERKNMKIFKDLSKSKNILFNEKSLHLHVSLSMSTSPCSCQSPCPCLHVHVSMSMSPCPCLQVSMSPCPLFHVSMSPCFHVFILYVSVFPCLYVSTSLCFLVSIFPFVHGFLELMVFFSKFRVAFSREFRGIPRNSAEFCRWKYKLIPKKRLPRNSRNKLPWTPYLDDSYWFCFESLLLLPISTGCQQIS